MYTWGGNAFARGSVMDRDGTCGPEESLAAGGVDSREGARSSSGLAKPIAKFLWAARNPPRSSYVVREMVREVPLGSRNVPRTFPGLSWNFPRVPRLHAKTAPSMLLRAAPRSRSPAPVSPHSTPPLAPLGPRAAKARGAVDGRRQAPLARESSEETLGKTGVRGRSRVAGFKQDRATAFA